MRIEKTSDRPADVRQAPVLDERMSNEAVETWIGKPQFVIKKVNRAHSDDVDASSLIRERVSPEQLSFELLENIRAQLRELPRHEWDTYLWRAGNEFVSALARARE